MSSNGEHAVPELVYHLPVDDPILQEVMALVDMLVRLLVSEAKKFGLASSKFVVSRCTDSKEDDAKIVIEQWVQGLPKDITMYQESLGLILEWWFYSLSSVMGDIAWRRLTVEVRWTDGMLKRTWIAWPL